jgi:hypothetical protein
MWNRPNRVENTVSIPDRGICTWLTATANVFDALAAIPKDMRDVVKYTSSEIKNIFKSAITKWKRYQRIWNTLLSPFVALWAAVEWAVRTVVTPSVNFVTNAYRTGKNAAKNAINSTFWSVFSKKPVSNFQYEELKTSNVIEKNKNWFSKRRFGRKIFKNKSWEDRKPNSVNHTNETRRDIKEEKKNKEIESKKDGKDLKNTKNMKKNKDITQDKLNNWTTEKGNLTGQTEETNTWGVSENNSEGIEKNADHKWVSEAKAILSDSTCGKIIIDKLCESHKDFWIIFDDTTSIGRWNENNTITIWTKMPNGIAWLAPFNWEARNPEAQKKHLLLHELWHCTVGSHSREIPGINEWLSIIQRYIDERKNIDWRTLSLLSYNNDTYPTSRKKAREDFVEMLALRMNWNWNLCKKYLNLLSDDEHKNFRENCWLATITKEHVAKLQNIFDSIIHYYENLSN